MSSAKDFMINIVANDDKARQVVDGFKAVAIGAAAGIAAGWAKAQIGAAMTASMDTAQAQSRLTAELGALPADAARFGALAGQVWAEGFTGEMPEINAGISAVRRNMGDLANGEMKEVTAEALAIADVFRQDIVKTTGAAGALMRNDLAPSAAAAMDIVAAGLQSTANQADDVLDTFMEYSPFFAKLGLDGAQSLGMLNQGMQAGARNSDFLADALKEFTIRGQEPVIRGAAEQAAALEEAQRAGESLARAQRSELAAQQGLNAAREQAVANLAEMAERLEGAALSERGAVIAVARAREQLREVKGTPEASRLDIDEAQLNYDQAVYALEQQRQSVADLAREKADADAAGVNGSRVVLQAQEQLTDAQRGVVDATKEATVANANAADNSTALGKAYQRLGIDGEWAANAIARGGPDAQRALQMVRDGLLGVADPVERNALAVQLFGTKAEDLQGALYAMDPSTATASLGEIGGAADRVTGALEEGPMTRVEEMRRGWANWLGEIINTKGPMGEAATWFTAFGGDIAGAVAGLGPLVGGLVLFRGAQTAATAATAANTAATAANNVAWWASPVTWIIAAIVLAIGLLVAAGIWLWQNWDGVTKWIGDAWSNLMLGFQVGGQVVGDWFQGFLDDIGRGAGWLGDQVDSVVGFFLDIPNRVSEGWTGLANLVSGVLRNIANFTIDAWNNTLGSIDMQLPWFLGGARVQFPKLNNIPALATGGIVTAPTLALVGEAGTEAVVPLSRAHEFGLGGDGGDTVVYVITKLDGRTVYESVERHKRKRR